MAFIRAEFMSQSLKRIVPVTVVIPSDTTNFSGTGTNPAKPPYKTLYLLHGIYGSDMDMIANTNVMRLARERQMAVVMPAGENHFYVDDSHNGMKYGEFIGKELVEATRRMFPLSCEREDTFIAGMSMGGYGALMNGIKYYDTFGYIASMSTAVITKEALAPGNPNPTPMCDPDYQQAVLDYDTLDTNEKNPYVLLKKYAEVKEQLPKMMITCGKSDPLFRNNERLSAYMTELGIAHEFIPEEGGHNFDFWRAAIVKILDWLPHGEIIPIMDSGDVFGTGDKDEKTA